MLAQTKYDPETKRAYIELRDQDDDGSDVAVVVIFSLQTTAGATQRTIEQEILRKALHLLTSATWHTQWRLSVGFGRRPFAPGALKMTPQILCRAPGEPERPLYRGFESHPLRHRLLINKGYLAFSELGLHRGLHG